MRLVFVTQALDAEHPVLAQTVDLVRALAARSEELVVLCASSAPQLELPANVRVRVFGRPSRAGRGLAFARALAPELLRRQRPDAVFAHMIPLFLVLAAPLAKPRGIPLLLWYTHWHAGRTLRVAVRLADVILSVDRRSFPLESPKVRGTGHAIDIEQFKPAAKRSGAGGPLRLLALGRTARWKGYDTMLAAVEQTAVAGVDVTLEIRGPQLTADEHAHRADLEVAITASEVLRDRVRIEPPLPRADLPALIAAADAVVSANQPRASATLDKVVYEAAACATPVLASNPALAEFLGGLPVELRFAPRDSAQLAERIAALAAAGPDTRAQAGAELRRRVVEGHSLESWADAVAAAITGQRRE